MVPPVARTLIFGRAKAAGAKVTARASTSAVLIGVFILVLVVRSGFWFRWVQQGTNGRLFFLRRLPFLHVGLPSFAEILADFRISLLGKIGERDADGPFRSTEAATGHEHDAAMLGQPEEHINALVILLEEPGEIRPVGLLGPHHQIELDVIVGPV